MGRLRAAPLSGIMGDPGARTTQAAMDQSVWYAVTPCMQQSSNVMLQNEYQMCTHLFLYIWAKQQATIAMPGMAIDP